MVILWMHMAAGLLNVKITCDCSLVCTLLRYWLTTSETSITTDSAKP